MKFFATAAKGTEPALRDELRELGIPGVRCDRGGVHFAGDWESAEWACLQSRVAIRVLVELGSFDAPNGEALYEGTRSLDWGPFLTPRHTLAVGVACRSSGLTHTNFIAQKTKDAIVDQLRDRLGTRPNVDRKDPDVSVFTHLVKDRATIYLDMAGQSLHRRGYRLEAAEAPLKETLAAAALRLSGWDRLQPLTDPMCGSGTFPIEAALWAHRIAPGIFRKSFGFERWATHDATAVERMRTLRERARANIRPDIPEIFGSDIDARTLDVARANAARAGVKITWSVAPIRDLQPMSPPGFVVINPPYGTRIEAEETLYKEMASVLRTMHGHTVALLAGNRDIERAMRVKPSHWNILYNGDIECHLLVYPIG